MLIKEADKSGDGLLQESLDIEVDKKTKWTKVLEG